MGNQYEVYKWVPNTESPKPDFHYVQVYGGENFQDAWKAMSLAKLEGSGCVKLEWR